MGQLDFFGGPGEDRVEFILRPGAFQARVGGVMGGRQAEALQESRDFEVEGGLQ